MTEETFESKIEALRAEYFPMKLTEGVYAHNVSEARLREVQKNLFGQVFPNGAPRFSPPEERMQGIGKLQESYAKLHYEFIVFYHGAVPIGWLEGEQEDWITFYLRNGGTIPEFQNKLGASHFLPPMLQYLKKVGYERVTSHHKPHNRHVLILMLKAGFNIEGTSFSERWGTLVHLVHFTHEDRQQFFERKFGS